MNDDKENNWPKKLTLINRSTETFNAYLSSQFGDRFYAEAFWDGISERRRETHAAVIKTSSSCFIFTSLLAFLNSISGKVTILGLSLEISRDLAPVLALIAASALLGTVNAIIDDVMLDKYINQIGDHIGIHSFQLFLLDKIAINLWSDALKPRYFGDQSGKGQKFALLLHATLIATVMLALLCYPFVFIALSAHNVFINPEAALAAQLLTAFSILILLWVTMIIIIFSIPFKFYQADFHEVGNKPTDHFKKRMNNKSKQPHNDDKSPPPSS